jgi:pyruvate carboxylase subunit B
VKYFVTSGDQTIEVSVSPNASSDAGSQYRVEVDGRETTVDYRTFGATGASLILNGRSTSLTGYDCNATGLVLLDDGTHSHALLVEDEREHTRAEIFGSADESGGAVRSVMPGIVRQVLVAEGDTVQVDQALLILEAMKMENEIRATAAGCVTRVHVRPGDTVEAGAALIDL